MRPPLDNIKFEKYPTGQVFQFYGENKDLYINSLTGTCGHPGIDLVTFEGDKVKAMRSGLVVHAGTVDNTKDGQVYIFIEEFGKGYLDHYAHMRNIVVSAGQQINEGDIIGEESNTGFVISGGTAYWGNAPAGKGVHLHIGGCEVTEVIPNTRQMSFSGGKYAYTVVNGLNCMKGWLDPLPLLGGIIDNKMIKFIRKQGTTPVYAVINGKFHYVSGSLFEDMVADGLARWEDVKEVDFEVFGTGW